jgi:hypothetical protein
MNIDMIFGCFLDKYPHGRAVKIAVKIAHKRLNIVNMATKADLDLAEKAFITGKTALIVMYP